MKSRWPGTLSGVVRVCATCLGDLVLIILGTLVLFNLVVARMARLVVEERNDSKRVFFDILLVVLVVNFFCCFEITAFNVCLSEGYFMALRVNVGLGAGFGLGRRPPSIIHKAFTVTA